MYFGLSAASAYCHSVGVLSMTTDFIGSLVLGGLDFFTRRYFAFEKEVLSAVSRLYLGCFKPNWLKFWPKVGLASLLDCYSLEKSGYLLKKRSFGRFPSLGGNRNKQGDLAILLIRIAKNKANSWQHG